jgi:hypothetical protein
MPTVRSLALGKWAAVAVAAAPGLGNETADRGKAGEVDEWQFTLASGPGGGKKRPPDPHLPPFAPRLAF